MPLLIDRPLPIPSPSAPWGGGRRGCPASRSGAGAGRCVPPPGRRAAAKVGGEVVVVAGWRRAPELGRTGAGRGEINHRSSSILVSPSSETRTWKRLRSGSS